MKEKLDLFRKDFNEQMNVLEEKHDVTIKLGTLRYDDTSAKATLELKLKTDASGKPIAQIEFENVCELYGLTPEHYGKTIIRNGVEYKLVAIEPKNYKKPIIIEDVKAGVRYKANKEILNNFK